MQRLHLQEIEKAERADLLAQRCAIDEVGVKEQSDDIVRHLPLGHLDIHSLPGSETDHCPGLIVIFAAPVPDGAVDAILQEQGIEAIGHAEMVRHDLRFLQVDNRDQRMTCPETVKPVVCLDTIEIDYVVLHNIS